MEGEWSCYTGSIMEENGHVMEVMPVERRENFHVTEVVTNGGRMVMLQKWSV